MAQSGWNGITKLLVRLGAVAVALSGVVTFGVQVDARYARAGDVRAIQADILELRREAINREYLELQREAVRRTLSILERERVDRLKRILDQIDKRLQAVGRSPQE